jgi:adenylate cyclase
MLPPGGAEIDIAILFADVRGSTQLGERLGPAEYASLLNRFYKAATETLIRHDAVIDKLIGDEVMALFIPGFCGPNYKRRAAEAGLALFHALGYQDTETPWMPIGAAVNSGKSYVGNVGSEGVVDFTALGDPVNTASRLASSAGAGELLLSEEVFETVSQKIPSVEIRTLNLRGKESLFSVRVLKATSAAPTD